MGSREAKAFALAPLPVVGPMLIMFGAIAIVTPSEGARVFGAMLGLLVWTYGVTLLIGVPVHLLLQRTRQTALTAYIGLTFLTVSLIAGLFALWDRLSPRGKNDNPFALHMWSSYGLKIALVFAALASLSAAIFWCVAIRRPKS